jgi:predicted ATPase/DNA-binding SARP family transcriptional activator
MEFATKRSALLLIRLALWPRRTFSRASLCELLWPDDDPQATRGLLRNELARLKRSLGSAADLVQADRASVRFNSEVATTDLTELLRALNHATQAEDAQTRKTSYEEATEIDFSNILPACDEPWIESERAKFRNYRRLALIGLGRAQLECGEPEAALHSFESAIQVQPAHEEAYVLAIATLNQLSRGSEAVEMYRRLERELRQSLGVPPSIVARAALERGVRRSAVSNPVDVAYLASNVPAPLSAIVGRSQEIGQVCDWLNPESDVRLVTLLGPGGMGKTRVSIEIANRLKGPYSDRVWFVELVDHVDPEEIPGAILSAMGLNPQGTANAAAILQANLPNSPSLVVLDNFEQLLEDGSKTIVRLLAENPSLRLLVTSRQRLNVGGEREYPIPPLGIEGAQADAVRLFLQIARAVQHRFRSDEVTLALVSEIVAKLEGIPLAITLAAARCDVLSPKDLLRQLDERFTVLISKRADLSERHHRLRDTLEWSYRLMSTELQEFFSELSVFRGGWTLEAAAAVSHRPDTIELIEGLRARSFIVAELGPLGMRFRMLETLREFAAERITKVRDSELRAQHLAFFAGLVMHASVRLAGVDQIEWFDRLDLDHENILAALAWAAENDRNTAFDLMARLLRFWQIRSHHSEASRWIAKILIPPFPIAKQTGDALFGAAQICHEQFHVKDAVRWYELALDVYTQVERPLDRCAILQSLAWLYNDVGDYTLALQYARESYDYQAAIPFPIGCSFALDEIARAKLGRGDLDGALQDALRTLEIRRTGKDAISPAEAEILVGEVFWQRSESDHAIPYLASALETCRNLGRTRLVALTQCLLAEIDLERNQLEAAFERIRYAQEVASKAGFEDVEIALNLLQAKVCLRGQQFDTARSVAKSALSIAIRLDVTSRILMCLDRSADVLMATKDIESAARLLGACDTLRTELDRPRLPRQQRERETAERRLLGAIKFERLQDLLEQGSQMSLEAAAKLALQLPV